MPSDVGMYRRVLRASIIARTVSKIRKVSVKKKTLTLRARDTGTFLFAKKKIRHHASFEGGVVAEGVDPAVSARDEVEVDDARGAGAGTGACACGAPAPLAISVARAETSGSSRPCALASAMRARARATTSSVWSESPRADPFPGAAFSASSSTSSASPPPSDVWSRAPGPPNPSPVPFVSTPRSALMPFLAPAESALGLCVIVCARTAMVPLASATKPSRECTFCEPASRSAPKAGAATYDRLPISGAPPT